MSVTRDGGQDWEDRLSEVMEKAAAKVRALAEERAQLLARQKLLAAEARAQEDADAKSKFTLRRLMDEITAQLKLKYELEHDISRIHSRKGLEERDLMKVREENSKLKEENKGEFASYAAKLGDKTRRLESAEEQKKAEIGKFCVANDKLRIELRELNQEVLAMRESLNLASEQGRSLSKKSRYCSIALGNLFKYHSFAICCLVRVSWFRAGPRWRHRRLRGIAAAVLSGWLRAAAGNSSSCP